MRKNEAIFFLYNLKEIRSRDFCRKKVEKIAKTRLNDQNIKLSHDKPANNNNS